jgi:hypothetical protein
VLDGGERPATLGPVRIFSMDSVTVFGVAARIAEPAAGMILLVSWPGSCRDNLGDGQRGTGARP